MQFEAPPLFFTIPKSTYFKANPKILRRTGTLQALQGVWETHALLLTNDPTRNFTLAWHRLRAQYKEIHIEEKNSNDPLEDLYAKLVQLKLEILDDFALFQNDKFQELCSQIREAKLIETNRIYRMARVVLDAGDEPRKLFFTLEAKQQRKSMVFLLLEDDICIENKYKILKEVIRFYVEHFQTTCESA